MSETCTLCDWTGPDRLELVRHKMDTHRPVPGQLFFAETVMPVHMNTGSGSTLYALGDGEGTIAMVHELPKETDFIDVTLAGSRLGGGTPVVVAYNPATVRKVGF